MIYSITPAGDRSNHRKGSDRVYAVHDEVIGSKFLLRRLSKVDIL